MVDFNLSKEQLQSSHSARVFAHTFLKDARKIYANLPTPQERFQSTRPIYQKAVEAGLLKSLVPIAAGGSGTDDMIGVALAVEELYAVEPSVTLTILSNCLAFGLLLRGGTPEQIREFISPFVSGEGTPLASLVYSEPGGSANFFEPGGNGMQTTAKRDGDSWILNGEKVCQVWGTNSAGWDFRGGDLQCVVCREESSDTENPELSAMILLIPRKIIDENPPSAYAVIRHMETPGHTACSGPHVKFTNLKVPATSVLAGPGTIKAVHILNEVFATTAALVGAMSVGIMRVAFESAFQFAKTNTAGGTVKLLERQSVADLLIDIKIQVETSRYLTWKAAHALVHAKGGSELAYEVKVSCSEAAIKCVAEAMKVVGISSYSDDYPLARLMSDALVLPLFDLGNVGVRRRQLQKLFLTEDYEPWQAAFSTRESA